MTTRKISDFVSANFPIVETSSLSILVLGLEACLDSGFHCPEGKVFGAFYSLAFLLIPFGILIILTVTMDPRARDHHRIRCKQFFAPIQRFFASSRLSCCCCDGSIQYISHDSAQEESRNRSCWESILLCLLELIVLLTLKAPLLWISAMLTDGRYSTCFIKSTFNISSAGDLGYQSAPGSNNLLIVKQITQIVGLGLFLFLFYLACKKDKGAILKCWYVKKYENLLLQDVDTELRRRAARGRAEFVAEHLSNMSWEGFNPKNADAEEALDLIIKSQQVEINRKLKREAEV